MARVKAPCGTEAAYRRHLRNREPIDDACRVAHRDLRREKRRDDVVQFPRPAAPVEQSVSLPDGAGDDLKLIVDTLRDALKVVAEDDPSKIAPIARELRAAVEALRGPAVEVPKEKSLAEQLADARAARASRAQG